MLKEITKNPFSKGALSKFVLAPNLLSFTDKEIIDMDKELSEYEQLFMNPEIEKNLISKNELLASFAISKAENSMITLKEAQNLYDLIVRNKEYNFISEKIKNHERLTQRDHDKLEFYNIAKTFRKLNQKSFHIKKLTPELIKNIHMHLTQGLDIFDKYLLEFDIYRSGKWRNNDKIRVDSYIPPSCKKITAGVEELITWLKKNYSIRGVGIFHTGLYALHPFNNGNKRICRILEHVLLRGLNINSKNLYSSSYYYHKQKKRYYKYLLYSLTRKNLNHFTSFVLEAVVLSIISTLKTSLEVKRNEFLENAEDDKKIKSVLKPLIKRREMQFKTLFKISKKRVARQTFVAYLQKTVGDKLLKRRKQGKSVYYGLNFQAPEEDIIERWICFVKKKLTYIPDEYKLM